MLINVYSGACFLKTDYSNTNKVSLILSLHLNCISLSELWLTYIKNNLRKLRLKIMKITFYEDLFVDHIACVIHGETISLSDGKLDILRRAHPWHGNIQLTMSKAWFIKPDTNILKSLSLRLIDSHGKGNTDRKLTSTPFEWEFPWLWSQAHSWNQNSPIAVFSTNNCAF